MISRFLLVLVLAGPAAACGGADGGSAPCGIAALAGATTLLDQFSVPNQTLGSLPEQLPERLVVRLAAGPAYPAVVGRSDSAWIIGVEGTLPANVTPTFGVLVLDPSARALGVMLYESLIVEGAPRLGTVSVDSRTVPLIGIQVDPARFQDPRCPFFPDSVLQS